MAPSKQRLLKESSVSTNKLAIFVEKKLFFPYCGVSNVCAKKSKKEEEISQKGK